MQVNLSKSDMKIIKFLFLDSHWSQSIVELSDGLIEGHVVETDFGNRFIAYEGVPYAQPPIGINRFSVS